MILPVLHYFLFIFLSKSNTFRIILKCYVFSFTIMYWLVGHESILSVPNANLFAAPTPPKRRIVYRRYMLVSKSRFALVRQYICLIFLFKPPWRWVRVGVAKLRDTQREHNTTPNIKSYLQRTLKEPILLLWLLVKPVG